MKGVRLFPGKDTGPKDHKWSHTTYILVHRPELFVVQRLTPRDVPVQEARSCKPVDVSTCIWLVPLRPMWYTPPYPSRPCSLKSINGTSRDCPSVPLPFTSPSERNTTGLWCVLWTVRASAVRVLGVHQEGRGVHPRDMGRTRGG